MRSRRPRPAPDRHRRTRGVGREALVFAALHRRRPARAEPRRGLRLAGGRGREAARPRVRGRVRPGLRRPGGDRPLVHARHRQLQGRGRDAGLLRGGVLPARARPAPAARPRRLERVRPAGAQPRLHAHGDGGRPVAGASLLPRPAPRDAGHGAQPLLRDALARLPAAVRARPRDGAVPAGRELALPRDDVRPGGDAGRDLLHEAASDVAGDERADPVARRGRDRRLAPRVPRALRGDPQPARRGRPEPARGPAVPVRVVARHGHDRDPQRGRPRSRRGGRPRRPRVGVLRAGGLRAGAAAAPPDGRGPRGPRADRPGRGRSGGAGPAAVRGDAVAVRVHVGGGSALAEPPAAARRPPDGSGAYTAELRYAVFSEERAGR